MWFKPVYWHGLNVLCIIFSAYMLFYLFLYIWNCQCILKCQNFLHLLYLGIWKRSLAGWKLVDYRKIYNWRELGTKYMGDGHYRRVGRCWRIAISQSDRKGIWFATPCWRASSSGCSWGCWGTIFNLCLVLSVYFYLDEWRYE